MRASSAAAAEMFRKDKSLALKHSVSAQSNNLSVYVDRARSTLHYAVVHKFFVNLVSSSLDGQTVTQRQVFSKEPAVTSNPTIHQVGAEEPAVTSNQTMRIMCLMIMIKKLP